MLTKEHTALQTKHQEFVAQHEGCGPDVVKRLQVRTAMSQPLAHRCVTSVAVWCVCVACGTGLC